jgi:hypothetical protein
MGHVWSKKEIRKRLFGGQIKRENSDNNIKMGTTEIVQKMLTHLAKDSDKWRDLLNDPLHKMQGEI